MPEDHDRTARILAHLAIPGNASKTDSELARELGVQPHNIARSRARQDKPVTEEIRIADISMDGDTQQRASIDDATVERYREHLRDGGTFDTNPVVFRDGTTNHLGGGKHRTLAAQREGRETILVDVRPGTLRDAVLYSCGDNAAHGKPRTSDDVRKAVLKMLDDPEWGKWSDVRIAEACRVGRSTVGRIRASLVHAGADAPDTRTVTRGGTTYEQQVPKREPKPDEGVTNFDPEAERSAMVPNGHDAPPATDDGSLAPRVMGDGEWLERFTLRSRLADHCRKLFDSEALIYRATVRIAEWPGFARKLKATLELKASGKKRGPVHAYYRRLLSMDPAKFMLCHKCNGQGTSGPVDCEPCYGAGFVRN